MITLIISIITFVLVILITAYFKLEFKKKYDKYKEIENFKNKIGIIYEIAMSHKSSQQKQNEYKLHSARIDELIGKFNKYESIAEIGRLVKRESEFVIFHEQEDGPKFLMENRIELKNEYGLLLKKCNNETSLILNSFRKLKSKIMKEKQHDK